MSWDRKLASVLVMDPSHESSGYEHLAKQTLLRSSQLLSDSRKLLSYLLGASQSTEAATDKFHTLHRDLGSSSACRPGIHRGNSSTWGELYKTESDRSHKAELETPLCSFVKGSISSYIEEHSWQWHLRELLHISSYDNSKVIAKAFAASRLAAGGCTWYLWCPYRREERSQTSKSCSPRHAKSLYSTAANAANKQTRKFVVPRLQSCNSSRRKVLSEETRARPPIWPRSAPNLSHFYSADLYCVITYYHATIQYQQICIYFYIDDINMHLHIVSCNVHIYTYYEA